MPSYFFLGIIQSTFSPWWFAALLRVCLHPHSAYVLPVKVQRIGSASTAASVALFRDFLLFIVCLHPHPAYVLPVKVQRIGSASTSASVALFRVCLHPHSAYVLPVKVQRRLRHQLQSPSHLHRSSASYMLHVYVTPVEEDKKEN